METLLDLQNKQEGDPSSSHAGVPKPKFRWWSRVVIVIAEVGHGRGGWGWIGKSSTLAYMTDRTGFA